MCRLFNFLLDLYVHVSKSFISSCSSLIHKYFKDRLDDFYNEAREILKDLLKDKIQEENKILPLVHEFSLYEFISYSKIVDLVLRINNIT